MNCFCFTGRIGADATVSYTPAGSAVCNFNVAVDAGYGDNKTTTWVRCTLWGKRAEGGVVGYLVKGALVGVSGELSSREYQKDGLNKTVIQVNANDVTLLGSKPEGAAQQPATRQPAKGQTPGQARGPDPRRAPQQDFGGGSIDDDTPF